MLPASKSCLTLLTRVHQHQRLQSLSSLIDDSLLVMSGKILTQLLINNTKIIIILQIIVIKTPLPPASSCDVWQDWWKISQGWQSPQTKWNSGIGGSAVEINNIGEQSAAVTDINFIY